ncbi:MAG: hypothetical protein K0M64_12175 [Rhizobium sp.]|nr:hypothetical protein [Rhizobium sp.]
MPQYTTGSAIMPNKRNPDLVELMRATYASIAAARTASRSRTRAAQEACAQPAHRWARYAPRDSAPTSCACEKVSAHAGKGRRIFHDCRSRSPRGYFA